jgi:hypothetical protein
MSASNVKEDATVIPTSVNTEHVFGHPAKPSRSPEPLRVWFESVEPDKQFAKTRSPMSPPPEASLVSHVVAAVHESEDDKDELAPVVSSPPQAVDATTGSGDQRPADGTKAGVPDQRGPVEDQLVHAIEIGTSDSVSPTAKCPPTQKQEKARGTAEQPPSASGRKVSFALEVETNDKSRGDGTSVVSGNVRLPSIGDRRQLMSETWIGWWQRRPR